MSTETLGHSAVRIIEKKRDGGELSREEIEFFISGLLRNEIPDYQATAFLMAAYFQDLTPSETLHLTRAMADSGEKYDLKSIAQGKPIVDKHSTGGVGDKVSLILAPLAAACGLMVPMMSGRGLGHTGGTLDKLEAISGFKVRLPNEIFFKLLQKNGVCMIGQSQTIAPADKKLYSLRDVTGTVENLHLITASILSKKVAEGTEGLVMDVKWGSGAFLPEKRKAKALASSLQKVSKSLGLQCKVLLSNMDQPLGYAVGNSLEVLECLEILKPGSHFSKHFLDTPPATSSDLLELTLELTAQMLLVGKAAKTPQKAREAVRTALQNGSAWKIFCQMVADQGGDLSEIENPSRLRISNNRGKLLSWKKGFIRSIDTKRVGQLLIELHGGRKVVEDKINPSTGLVFHSKLGDAVSKDQPLVTIFFPENWGAAQTEWIIKGLHSAITLHTMKSAPPRLFELL